MIFHFGRRNDATEPGRSHDEIILSWSAKTWLLRKMYGTLRMRISMPGTLLVLHGQYATLDGALGSVFDRFIGARIASSIGNDLLVGIAERAKKWCDE